MSLGEVLSSIISGTAVLLLAWIAHRIGRIGRDFRRFMAEHMWLISTTLWTRDKVLKIMTRLDMPMDGEPPADLPRGRLSWESIPSPVHGCGRCRPPKG